MSIFDDDRAQLGARLIDAVDAAISDIDSGGYEIDDLRAWGPLCAEARERWPELVAMLGDPDAAVRASGCAAIAALARAAWHPPDWGKLDAEPLRPELVAIADRLPLTDASADVRAAALGAVRWIPGDGPGFAVVTDKAIELLADHVGAVRAEAVRVVAEIFHQRADIAVLYQLCADDDPLVEQALVECLMRTHDPAVAPVLLRRLQREGPATSTDTVRHIKVLGVPARDALLAVMTPDADGYARASAAEALIETVDAGCVPRLLDVLRIGDFSSMFAAMALMRLGADARDASLADAIVARGEQPPANYPAHLQRNDDRLVSATALLIAAAGQVEHAPALMRALEAESAVRLGAGEPRLMRGHLDDIAFALASLGHAPVFDWLRDRLARGANVGLALGQLGDARVVPQLVGIRDTHAEPRFRRDAAIAIAAIDPARIDAQAQRGTQSWPQRDVAGDATLVFALRTLAARLAASPPTEPALRLIDWMSASIRELAPVVAATVNNYRGRGTSSSARDGYVFVIRDWLADAARDLVRARAAARN